MAERHQRIDVVDNDGKRVPVTQVTARTVAGTPDNPHAFVDGLVDYYLPDGSRLNRTAKGFETIDGSRWFTRV